MTPAEHATTVRDALKNPVVWDGLEMQFDALAALVALAERATELERERDEVRRKWHNDNAEKVVRIGRLERRAERAETALREIADNEYIGASAVARAALGETAPSAPRTKTSS